MDGWTNGCVDGWMGKGKSRAGSRSENDVKRKEGEGGRAGRDAVCSPEGACPKGDVGFAALPFIPPWGVCPRRPEQPWL